MSFITHLTQLQNNSLFSLFTRDQQLALSEKATIVNLSRGENLYQQGDPNSSFGFVLSGSLKLFRLTQDGQEKVFRILQAGDCLAERVLFSGRPDQVFTATAVETAQAVLFPIGDFRDAVQSNTAASFEMLSRLAQLELTSLETMEILSFKKSLHRVIRYLATKALKDCTTCEAPKFELPASKRLIASKLSIQPETLSRVLNQLERDGLLRLEGRTICILDLPALLQNNLDRSVQIPPEAC